MNRSKESDNELKVNDVNRKKSLIYQIVELNIDNKSRLKIILIKNLRHGELDPELLDKNHFS
jgi:hypothetical protein